MKKLLPALSILVFLFNLKVHAQTGQTVTAGMSTTAVTFPAGGCTYNWVNDKPGIGLPASGTGDISSFTAVNSDGSAVQATITATPVSESFAYIGNNAMTGNDFTTPQTVSVINTATGTVVSTITVGVSPMGVSVTPDGKWVYVTNEFSDNVSVINASTNKVVATVPVGTNPAGISVTPSGNYVYVANLNSNNISVISTASNKVVATITVGTTPQNGPGRIVVSPDGNFVYITYFTSPTTAAHITVINTATNSVSATIALPTGGIDDMAISPDGSRLYVPDYLAQLLYIVDIKTQSLIASIKTTASPVGIAVSPDGNFVYVAESNFNNVLVISTATNSIVTTVPVGQNPNAIALTSDGKYVYVQNTFSNSVSVISTLTNKVINTIPVGGGPEGYGNFISPQTVCTGIPITSTITVNPVPAAVPTITTGSTTGNIVACLGVASVSPYIQQFTVSGANLTGDITATAATSQFEISLNPNSGYSASLTIPQTGGLVNSVIVYARAAATGSSGPLTGGVKLTSPGAQFINAGLTGLVNGLPYMGGVAPQVFTGGQLSTTINFVTNGNNVSWANSNAGIGLAATGSGNILPFTPVNNSGAPISAKIIATPVSPAGGCTGTPISFIITVNPAPATTPTIAAGTATGNITACLGQASASPNLEQFTVSGSDLSDNITLGASGSFEISLNPVNGFAANLTIASAGGTVSSTTVYVRSAASAAASGTVTGTVTISSTGALSQTVAVKGVLRALPTVNTVQSQSLNNGVATMPVSFSGTASTFSWFNDTPGIGLAASGTGNIASFTAVNTGISPVTATVTVRPIPVSFAYAPNVPAGTISVINMATGAVVSQIPVGSFPAGVSVSPDGSRMYVTNLGSGTVSIISTVTNTMIATVPVGISPDGMVVSPDGNLVYVVNMGNGIVPTDISVISTATNTVIATIAAPRAEGLALSPDGSRLYITGTNVISVFNTGNNQLILTIPVGTDPTNLALSPDGSLLYVSNFIDNTVSVVNTASNAVIATIPVGTSPINLTVSPDGSLLYVANHNGSNISVINTATNTVTATIPVGSLPIDISFSPDGAQAYVINEGSNSISVINTATNTITNTVQASGTPQPFGNFVLWGNGCPGTPTKFTITVNPAPAAVPAITTGSTTGNIVACLGVASVSPYIQQFTVSGTNLTGDITGMSTFGFEISLNPNSGYGNSITIPETGGTVNNVVVYARAAATTSSGNLTGGVKLTSPGAQNVNAGLTGLINGLPYMGGVAPQVFTGGQLSTPISFTTNGNSVSWTNDTPSIGLPAAGTGNIQPFTPVNNTNAPVSAKIIATPVSPAGGCTGTPISFIITVNPNPATASAITNGTPTGNIIACLGEASVSPNIAQFPVNGTNLTTGITATATFGFEVSLNAGSGYGSTLTIPQTGGIVNNVIVYVRAAATTSSGNLSGGVTLSSTGAQPENVGLTGIVNGLPIMGGVSPKFYVNGDITSVIAFSNNGNTITWTNDSPGIGLAASGTGDIPSFTAINNGTTAIVATITATPVAPASGCTGTPVTFTITVSPSIPSSIAVVGPLSPLNTIYGTPSTSTVFSVVGTSLTEGILIIPPVGFEVSSNDVAFAGSLTISPSGTQVYIRLAATTHVGSYSGRIILSSVGAPAASLDMPLSTVTQAPLTIAADNKTKTVGTANPELTATYTGFVNGDTPADLTSPVVLSTIADISSPIGVYPITLSGYASKDYTITAFPGILTVIGAIVIPNTFTPNGDGINDSWNIKYLDVYNSCTVQIFTRYGQNVYSSIGYGTPWDGTYKGAKLPTGTYYYVINLKNDTKPLAGFVVIIR